MSAAIACPERDLLWKHYNDAVIASRVAVEHLDAGPSASEFEVAYKRAEETSLMFEQTREQLRARTDAHGCQPNGGSEQF